ncbi:MAG: sulfur carrier protein ThiS [Casimicrobiaceae bacterium]
MLTLTVNGKTMELATGSATLADVVTRMGLEGKRIAIERNGEIVPRSRYATTPVASGDRLEIVGAVGGG